MARTKQTARRSTPPLITWTRFHLPLEQELPTWPVDHVNVYHGPLEGVPGKGRVSLGRIVENPEQATYIIEWATLDDLKNFQSSPACAEFLRNLPEHRNSQVSVESSAALRHLTVEDSSLLSPPASSRFLALQRATQTPTEEVKGRVTVTTFVVPHQVDDVYHQFRNVFNCFCPRGSRFIASPRYSWTRTANVWYRVLAEDRWVEEKFGRLEPTQEDSLGRTTFCHFLIWPLRLGATREDEEASVANPEAIESWNQHIAQVMPPAITWEQERWDIRDVPYFDPFEDEYDPELTPEQLEVEKEQRRLQKEYRQLHPPEYDEWLNPVGRR